MTQTDEKIIERATNFVENIFADVDAGCVVNSQNYNELYYQNKQKHKGYLSLYGMD